MIVFVGAPYSPSISCAVYFYDLPTRSALPQTRRSNARDSIPQHRELVRRLIPVFSAVTEPLDAKERQSPSPGSTVELGFLGAVLHVELPLSDDSQQLAETGTFDERFNPTMHVSDPSLRLPDLS